MPFKSTLNFSKFASSFHKKKAWCSNSIIIWIHKLILTHDPYYACMYLHIELSDFVWCLLCRLHVESSRAPMAAALQFLNNKIRRKKIKSNEKWFLNSINYKWMKRENISLSELIREWNEKLSTFFVEEKKSLSKRLNDYKICCSGAGGEWGKLLSFFMGMRKYGAANLIE